MSIDGLITVYEKATGQKVRIPPHWMDNPDLSAPFERTPSSRSRESDPTDAGTPNVPVDTSTTNTARADRPGRPSTTVQSNTETPAAGAKE